jgi:nitrite reductase (NADH) small subunit
MSHWIELGRTVDFPGESPVGIDLPGRRIALFLREGKYHAVDAICPHKGGPLEMGYVDGKEVYCPLHGWAFDMETGACKDSPDKPVRVYQTRVTGDKLEIELP